MITITAQTELSELIDTNKIETETNRVKGVITGELVESSQVIIKEQNSGALSTEFVNYSSVYYTKGATVIRYFNIVKDDLSSFATNVINAAIKKELSELDELEAAVKAEQAKQETAYSSAYNNTNDDAAKTSIKNSYYGTNGTLTLLAKKLSDIGIRRNELSAKSATYSGDGDSNYGNDNRFNPNAGSGNGSGDGSGTTGDSDKEKTTDTTNGNKTGSIEHSKGDKIEIEGKKYTVQGYQTTDKGTIGIYKGEDGKYYYMDSNNNIKPLQEEIVSTGNKHGTEMEHKEYKTEDGEKINISGLSNKGTDDKLIEEIPSATDNNVSSDNSTGSNPTEDGIKIYKRKNGDLYYIDDNGNEQDVKLSITGSYNGESYTTTNTSANVNGRYGNQYQKVTGYVINGKTYETIDIPDYTSYGNVTSSNNENINIYVRDNGDLYYIDNNGNEQDVKLSITGSYNGESYTTTNTSANVNGRYGNQYQKVNGYVINGETYSSDDITKTE